MSACICVQMHVCAHAGCVCVFVCVCVRVCVWCVKTLYIVHVHNLMCSVLTVMKELYHKSMTLGYLFSFELS